MQCLCAWVQGMQYPCAGQGRRLAQFSGVSPLSTGYYLTQKATRNQLRCLNPFQGNFSKNGGTSK